MKKSSLRSNGKGFESSRGDLGNNCHPFRSKEKREGKGRTVWGNKYIKAGLLIFKCVYEAETNQNIEFVGIILAKTKMYRYLSNFRRTVGFIAEVLCLPRYMIAKGSPQAATASYYHICRYHFRWLYMVAEKVKKCQHENYWRFVVQITMK